MVLKWLGPLGLLAVLVIGDQIRINRPGHKYRLTVEVETPAGMKSASSVLAVTPDRGYVRGGNTRTSGDAVLVDLGGGKSLVALLLHRDGKLDPAAINYVALRAYTAAAGKRVNFNDMSKQTGIVPVEGALIPILLASSDPANPGSMKLVSPDDTEATLGNGFRLRRLTAEVVPNGFWPLDFGGALGEPVTRGIATRLAWLGEPNAAAVALKAAGLPDIETFDAREAFARK
jgi:hypothetical protein